MKIEGRDNIQAYLQEELERMWKELELKHRGVKGQLFVALCLMVNDFSRDLRKKGIINPEDQNLFFRYETLLLTLDAFLEHGWNTVTPPGHKGEIQSFANIIIRDFQDLGRLLGRMEDSRSHRESSLHIPEDKKIVDELVQSIGSKKYLKVQFDELTTSRLVRFEQEELGIFDVALLTECEQLIDVESGKRHDVSINAEALVPLKIVHLLSEYPNLESTILSLIEDLQLEEAEDYEEGLEAEEHLEPEYEEGLEEEQEHAESEYEEGLEEESEYLEPE